MAYLIGGIVVNIFAVICVHIILDEKINFKDFRLYLFYIILVVATMLNSLYAISGFKIINSLLIYMLYVDMYFKFHLKNSLLCSALLILFCTVAEIVFLVIFQILLPDYQVQVLTTKTALINNIVIGIIWIMNTMICKGNRLYNNLLKLTERLSDRLVIIMVLCLMGTYNILSMIYMYIKMDALSITYLVVTSALIVAIMCIIVFNYIRSQTRYVSVSEKYNLSLHNIQEYEIIFDNYKTSSHENKNQLLIIRNMSKNKKIINYIDALIENKLSDDEQLLLKVVKIPPGGLRGLIYSKLLVMKDKKINYELLIEKKVSFKCLHQISNSLLIDICKIMGVFLDNAIEAVEHINDKYITIEIYQENKNDLVFTIINSYSGYVSVEKLKQPGYTSKGSNRGYGLVLVNELVNKHKELDDKIEFIEDNFAQTLRIKINE